jgi:hypothetical protein
MESVIHLQNWSREVLMMSGFEITCANKNQRGLIVRIGGQGWSMEARDAIKKIMSNQVRLRIRVNEAFTDIGIRGEGFDAYLVLEPEGFALHDLNDLPSC